ncbi:MAG: protein-L-isoaspartate(D-aspartate) O-methyltransferase [bacterium]|nr:protein-L-isoaspartate(D-aspartate) O-methyltransferase [bacterium]
MKTPEDDFAVERERMVERQLEPRGINDPRVLAAFRTVPRHRFLPPDMAHAAYADHPLPIGEGQTISQPYMVALMTQCMEVRPGDRVLEIGTGSGYQAAILAELGAEVYTIERIASLSERSGELLDALGYGTVRLRVGDGTLGWPEAAPFDGIIVTAGAPRVPEPLVGQLAEGGRLVIPVGGGWSQDLIVVRKAGGRLTEEEVCGCVFVPLLGKHGWNK